MKLTIGFSPCPNDTFIFDALVNKKIDTEGIEFDARLEDIETLNMWSNEGKLDITKLSFPAFFNNVHQYLSLPSGAALGNGVGPLLVAKKKISFDDVPKHVIAIPGENTTANFLCSFAFPEAQNRLSVLFSMIEETVLNENADIGLLIHENRFTYQQKGLIKILDLGEYWEEKTDGPIPLACIGAKRDLDSSVQKKVGELIKRSVEFAFQNYPFIPPFVKAHAQAMDEKVMRQHIDLYVNSYSIQLGVKGMDAIKKFYRVFSATKSVEKTRNEIELFV